MKKLAAFLLSVLILLTLSSCYVYTKEPPPAGSVGPSDTSPYPPGAVGPGETSPPPAGAVGPARQY